MPSGVYKRVIPVWNKGIKTGSNPEHSKRMMGKPSWNKGLKKGDHPSIKKMGFKSGHKSLNWKGDNACKRAVHQWVVYHRGKASEYKCINCNKQARDWSNIDHKYKRNLDDYRPLCNSCHQKYDRKKFACRVANK